MNEVNFFKAVWAFIVYFIKNYLRLFVFVSPIILGIIIVSILGDFIGPKLGMSSEHIDVMIILGAWIIFVGFIVFFIKTGTTENKHIKNWRCWYQRPEQPQAMKDLLEYNRKKNEDK